MMGKYLSEDQLYKIKDYTANILLGKIPLDRRRQDILVGDGGYRAENIRVLALLTKYGGNKISPDVFEEINKRLDIERRIKRKVESEIRRTDLDRFNKDFLEKRMDRMDAITNGCVRQIYWEKTPQ